MRLTEDHKPDRPDEAERIRGLGGDVVLGGRCWRVSHSGTSNPNLALTHPDPNPDPHPNQARLAQRHLAHARHLALPRR